LQGVKRDWLKGFIFFCIALLSMLLAQTLPTDMPLFGVILGVFEVASLLYLNGRVVFIGNIIAILVVIACIIFIMRYRKTPNCNTRTG